MSVRSPDHGRTTIDWFAVLLAVVLAGLHAYVGIANEEGEFLVVAGLFLAGVLVFFTRYWRAILYLLAAMYVVALGVLWFLGGMEYRAFGLLTGVVSVVFVGLAIYQFVRAAETLT